MKSCTLITHKTFLLLYPILIFIVTVSCGGNSSSSQDASLAKQVFENGQIEDISSGYDHSLILKTDGSLWACGKNSYSQLGDGTDVDKSSPINIINSGVTAISAGEYFSLVIKEGGTLYRFGLDNLLVARGAEEPTPKIVSPNDTQNISAGSLQSLVIKNDSSLWIAGSYQGLGEHGYGWYSYGEEPVKVLDSGVKKVAAGKNYSLIIKTDGSLWVHGLYSEFPSGNSIQSLLTQQRIPVEIEQSGIRDISAGLFHCLVLKEDDSLWTMGINDHGQLGNNTLIGSPTLNKVSDNVESISAGGYHSLMLKKDGSVWACGSNSNGQLGDGSTEDKTEFKEIVSANVIKISSGSDFSLILKSDKSVYGFGNNSSGQLGVLGAGNILIPTKL